MEIIHRSNITNTVQCCAIWRTSRHTKRIKTHRCYNAPLSNSISNLFDITNKRKVKNKQFAWLKIALRDDYDIAFNVFKSRWNHIEIISSIFQNQISVIILLICIDFLQYRTLFRRKYYSFHMDWPVYIKINAFILQ